MTVTLDDRASAIAFDSESAALAAQLYTSLPRARGREINLAIGACAIAHDAVLWTVNRSDFADIPDLKLHT